MSSFYGPQGDEVGPTFTVEYTVTHKVTIHAGQVWPDGPPDDHDGWGTGERGPESCPACRNPADCAASETGFCRAFDLARWHPTAEQVAEAIAADAADTGDFVEAWSMQGGTVAFGGANVDGVPVIFHGEPSVADPR